MNIDNFIKTLIGYEEIDVLDFYLEKDKYHPDENVFVARFALWKDEQYRA